MRRYGPSTTSDSFSSAATRPRSPCPISPPPRSTRAWSLSARPRRTASALEKIHQRPLLRRHPLARGDQRAAERVAAGAGLVFAVFADGRRDQLLYAPEAAAEQREDLVRRGVLCRILAPAVVVGDHRDRAVTELRLERKERLGHVGHADQVRPR